MQELSGLSPEHVNGQCLRIILQRMDGYTFTILELFYQRKGRSRFQKYLLFQMIIVCQMLNSMKI
ncbi:hypothetical protein NS29R_03760 [Enterobacter hormaechei subsp. xiangfangensis]|nr:hypothetical protein NS28R_19280 [Enterobacter hormaechei subsp. xiangfangensis]KTQ59324.1 hypothetical protein NS23R_06640 [Enterobacter hormaechei]KTQ62407.1 hypothetical protein NS34R_14575 [Enterobacter hormaechei]KTQ67600.1 hypothetical protein NS19R_19220 [Enterobacter hormaechei subsp. xiangfangensis]KTQ77408.1 hypothetical protein NS7_17790 [Enterobacter hormaechei]